MTERRLYSIEINGEPFISESDSRQFRVTFDVDVNPGDSLSLADIGIYNLAKTTVINNKSSITLRAGYTNAVDTIFTGFITNTFREREGASIVTRLLCKSGDPVEDRGSLNSSYGTGVKLVDVLKDIAKQWPRQLDMDEKQFDGIVLTSGYMIDGDIPRELNTLSEAFNFDWVQDRGRLVITQRDKERTGAISEVSQFTGMIGYPEVTRGPNGLGVYVVTKLNPYHRINGRINVKSEFSTFNAGNLFVVELAGDASANGVYNIFAIRYRGDTHGSIWRNEIDALRANSAPPAAGSVSGLLAWGSVVDQSFRVKVREIAGRLNVDPSWLMAIMAFETGNTFSPGIKNAAGSSATGLIQFTKSTAISLGTTTQALGRMSAVEQLDYVEKYFNQYKGRLGNLADCYMAVLWPKAIGKPSSYVLWTSPSSTYNQNAGLDKNRDGTVTKQEAAGRVEDSLKRGSKFAK